jgi:hypothetical protein
MSSPSPRITADTKVRISPRVYARGFGEEIVLLDFAVGEYFGLDPVGAEIWRGLEKGESLQRIADSVVEHWDVSREEALRDIVELVGELAERTLVEPAA